MLCNVVCESSIHESQMCMMNDRLDWIGSTQWWTIIALKHDEQDWNDRVKTTTLLLHNTTQMKQWQHMFTIKQMLKMNHNRNQTACSPIESITSKYSISTNQLVPHTLQPVVCEHWLLVLCHFCEKTTMKVVCEREWKAHKWQTTKQNEVFVLFIQLEQSRSNENVTDRFNPMCDDCSMHNRVEKMNKQTSVCQRKKMRGWTWNKVSNNEQDQNAVFEGGSQNCSKNEDIDWNDTTHKLNNAKNNAKITHIHTTNNKSTFCAQTNATECQNITNKQQAMNMLMDFEKQKENNDETMTLLMCLQRRWESRMTQKWKRGGFELWGMSDKGQCLVVMFSW